MTQPPPEPTKQPTSPGTPSSNTLKFSKKRLALAILIAGISDAIGFFINPLPPLGWVADFATALLLFLVLGRQWLLLPGLALEAIPGLGVLPFWLLVVGAIAVLGSPRPTFGRQHQNCFLIRCSYSRASLRYVCIWQILLQKSFCTGGRKFCGPLIRFSCKDVGGLISCG